MIKSTTGDSSSNPDNYPKLLRYKNTSLVVLAIGVSEDVAGLEKFTGVVVHPGEGNELGHFSDDWNVDVFFDYDKPVTLENV